MRLKTILLKAGRMMLAVGLAMVPGSGCKTQSVHYKISGGDGSTPEQAVIIHARDIAGATAAEVAWLRDHCPACYGVTNRYEASAGRIYSVATLATTNGETKLIYFDLSDPIRNSPRAP